MKLTPKQLAVGLIGLVAVGAGLVAVGAAMVFLPAGLMVGGVEISAGALALLLKADAPAPPG